jgi:hypothetical protein
LDPKFKAWRNTTMGVLERFLGKAAHHTSAFRSMDFFSMEMNVAPFGGYFDPDYISPGDEREFKDSCAETDELLRAAIREVEDFGVYAEEPKPALASRGRGKSGVSQNFHGTVNLNQAIASDSAVQRIGRIGNKTGADLKEISNLLQQSMDLTPRQAMQGVADIEALAVEVEKPEEKRNWRAVLDSGQRVLEVAGKAIDLGAKVAPYTPALLTLVDQAKHFLK